MPMRNNFGRLRTALGVAAVVLFGFTYVGVAASQSNPAASTALPSSVVSSVNQFGSVESNSLSQIPSENTGSSLTTTPSAASIFQQRQTFTLPRVYARTRAS